MLGLEVWAGNQSVPEELQALCSEGVWDVGTGAWIPGWTYPDHLAG